MDESVDFARLTRMLTTAAERIRSAREELSKLDAATGDGDHGTAMSKVADAVTATVEAHAAGDMKALLDEIGWAAMGTDAGSTGPLYGSLFLGMSQGVGEAVGLDAAGVATMLEAGREELRGSTKAEVGNKTMVDALVPAVEALRAGAGEGGSVLDCLRAAARAAAAGAESTREMKATFGRAKNIGERAIGHVDPGAASMAIVFEGLMEGYEDG